MRVTAALSERMLAGEAPFLRQAALSLGSGPASAVDEPLTRLALRHGALPFMADALVSSWNGRELDALNRLSVTGPGARPVLGSLTAAILQSGVAEQIDALFAQLAHAPPWWIDAVMDGVDHFIPADGGRRRTAFLPHEPQTLVAFSRRGGPQSARATEFLKYLRWRGQQIDESMALATLSEPERKRFAQGREEFTLCAACHQPQGQGMAGLAPPLVGSPRVNGNPSALIRIVLQGKTRGETTMPPLAALADEKNAAILTFVRRSGGHESSPVTAAQVQAVRSETKLREEPWTEEELDTFN
jgi:mono/diheme cytochrome c family protein